MYILLQTSLDNALLADDDGSSININGEDFEFLLLDGVDYHWVGEIDAISTAYKPIIGKEKEQLIMPHKNRVLTS
jgi:hypothetical protein